MQMLKAIEDDPTNQVVGQFYKHTDKARKQMRKIDEQITHNMAMKRAAEGRPVHTDGYSGRKQNRR